MIAIVDYGVGNLFSLSCSFDYLGAKTVVTGDKSVIEKADKILLPGVGAFGDAAKKLTCGGYDLLLRELADKNKPILGICLGMQLLFDKSLEYGEHKGIGLIKGSVVPMKDMVGGLKVPQMGWNALKMRNPSPIYKYVSEGECVYFVHSYHAVDCEQAITATTEYGVDITASVQSKNVFGCQFHPEKSGRVGLNVLKAFTEL